MSISVSCAVRLRSLRNNQHQQNRLRRYFDMSCALCRYYDICVIRNENTDACKEIRDMKISES